jgi:hypothetical protein
MIDAMINFARERDFRVARRTFSMSETKALEFFSSKKVIQRGWFYCSMEKDSKCTFRVQFTYDFQQRR